MKYFGYTGKILNIDLSTKEIWEQPLEDEIIENFIGGFGVNARIFYDIYKPGTDPLSPENPLVIGCGPFVGTFVPGTSKTLAITRFPLTKAIGEASAGMNLGNRLKYAGYDGLNLLNGSKGPIYVQIFDDSVKICDASFLWGKDIYETTDWFWDNLGTDWSILAIGPAGENQVRFSIALVDKVSTLGKGGLGAVMGVKNIKAVAVKGTKGLKVAEPERLLKHVNGLIKEISKAPYTYKLMEYGHNTVWNQRSSNFLYKNYTESFSLERAEKLFGPEVYLSKAKKGRIACLGCPLAEKELLKIKEGDFKGMVTYMSNWPGRMRDWGIKLDLSSYDQFMKCFDLANRYGLCSQSTSSIIELAVDLYNKGVISKEDTNGLDLKLGFDTALKLMKQIVFREGIGQVLAEGFLKIIERYGKEAERNTFIFKGMDPQLDPRSTFFASPEFEQMVNPRGGRHQPGGTGMVKSFDINGFKGYSKKIGISEESLNNIFSRGSTYNLGSFTKHAEDWYVIISSLGICEDAQIMKYYDIERLAELYAAITGIEKSPGQLKKAGERAWNLIKIMNVLEGFTRKDDKLPERAFEPIEKGKTLREHYTGRELTKNDTENILNDYYRERGWRLETGIPGEEKCRELGFSEDLISKLSDISLKVI